MTFTTTVGVQYRIAVGGIFGTTGPFSLGLSAGIPLPMSLSFIHSRHGTLGSAITN